MTRALGVLLALAALLSGVPAMAATSCDTTNLFSYNFNSSSAAQLGYGNTYSYTASSGGGATRSFNVNLTQNGLSSAVLSNGVTLPRIDTNPLSTPSGGKELTVGGTFGGRTQAITGTSRVILVTFSFTTPIRELAFTVHDIDYTNNQYRDWLYITGSNGANTYSDPTLALQTTTSVRVGPGGSPALAANEAIGTASSDNASTTGNIDVLFKEPVTSVTLRYGNYPFSSGESATGQQFMGISKLSFCPLPSLAVTKTSAPYDTTGTTRFAIPGADVAYTLTVTNSGGSTVDLSSLVLTDILPANVTFYNGDFNSSSPGMGPFELTAGSSAVSLSGAGESYSSNGGASYGYTPAAGYDANVDAVRLVPSGTMAANSSFTIRFRARVN